jgi:hypothetical protein
MKITDPPFHRHIHIAIMILFIPSFVYSGTGQEMRSLVSAKLSKENQEVLRLLQESRLEIAGYDKEENRVHLLIDPEDSDLLDAMGLQWEVIFQDINREFAELRFGGPTASRMPGVTFQDTTLGAYHTYYETGRELQQITEAYPSITRLDTLGYSLEGRIIWGLKISDNVSVEEANEPEVLYMGNHHARELISVEVPLHFANYLVENYGTASRVTEIVDTRQIWIVPMVNPDGHAYVEKYNLSWRKNRRDNGDGTLGVDLNRNYGYQWGYDDIGSSPNGGDYNYRGDSAWSEPEIRAIRDFVESHTFVTALTYHAYGNKYIYPWGYINEHSVDQPVFETMAIRFGVSNNYRHGNSWETLVYYMNGEAVDWLYGETTTKPAIFAMTVEVGSNADYFFPDTSRIVLLALQNLEPNLQLAEWSDNPWRIVPPLSHPILGAVTRSDSGDIRIIWKFDAVTNLGGFRLSNLGYGGWDLLFDEQFLNPADREITFPLPSTDYFRLAAVDTAATPATSFASDTYGASIHAQAPTVLIVDGFDRSSGSWTQLSHSFSATVGIAIDSYGWNFETCDNDALAAGDIHLADYFAVVWILGDESTIDETFSSVEQGLVAAYLEGGGRLFVSGSEIGWDLDYRGSVADRGFYHDYLKSAYIRDDSGILSATGKAGTIMDGLTIDYGELSLGAAYHEDYPDVITPIGGSSGILTYSGSADESAAIQYEGYYGDSTVPAKLIVMAFPFETIHDKAVRIELIARILEFFNSPFLSTIILPEAGAGLRLGENYPNPFNTATQIIYYLAETGWIELSIYDLLGRKLKVLFSGQSPAGEFQKVWGGDDLNGRPVASGVYILRLESNEMVLNRKMLLLK